MLPIALMTLFGVGLIATFVGLGDDDPVPAEDTPDTDDGAETPPETQITPLVELLPTDGPAETFEAEDLDRETTGEERLLVVGGPEDETLTIDPETTEDLYLDLTSGGQDVVIAPVGQDMDALDPEEDGTPDSPDQITLLFDGDLPGEVDRQDIEFNEDGVPSDWVYDYHLQSSSLNLNSSDTLTIETPEDLGGSILPVYLQTETFPVPPGLDHIPGGNSVGGEDHHLLLYHVPEGITPDQNALVQGAAPDADGIYRPEQTEILFEQIAIVEGLTPMASIFLGDTGRYIDNDADENSFEWDNIRDAPTLSSTLEFLPQLSLIRQS